MEVSGGDSTDANPGSDYKGGSNGIEDGCSGSTTDVAPALRTPCAGKVTELKCKGGTPYPMSVKEGTIKKDPSKKARDLPAPDGGVVTPAELRQMKKDARKVPARRGWLAVCDCLSLPGGLDRGMAYGVRRASGKKVTYFFFLLQAYESPNSRGQSQTYV